MGTTISSIASGGGKAGSERRPYLSILGCRNVLGASQFLVGFGNMEYRARTEVEVALLRSEREGGGKRET